MSFRRPSHCRAAFTLLEVLLVLCVLAVVIGISWPSVVRYVGDQALRESAQSVQSAAAGTRIKAVDTGLTYQFRYEPNGRRFAVLPFDPPQNIDSTTQASPVEPAQSVYPVLSGQIAESCRFTPDESRVLASMPVERLPREAFVNLPDAYELSMTAWAPPVLFHPDGTATDAAFRVVDEENRSVLLSVRGLTGTVAAGPVERRLMP